MGLNRCLGEFIFNHHALQEYYRQKRIRRILHFYHRFQPEFALHSDKNKAKTRIISRDAVVHFLLTIIAVTFLLGLAESSFKFFGLAESEQILVQAFKFLILAGLMFLAVEVADFIYYRTVGVFDVIFDYILPIGLSVISAIGYLATQHFDLRGRVAEGVKAKQAEFASKRVEGPDLSTKPSLIQFAPVRGHNWVVALGRDGKVYPLTLQQAAEYCRRIGPEWSLYKAFDPNPPIRINSDLRVWTSEGFTVILSGPNFTMVQGSQRKEENGVRMPTLCVLSPSEGN